MPSLATLTIEHDRDERRIARLTLNRPEKLNAISSAMPDEIAEAVRWAEADDDVHVVIVEGAGRAFCAGFDMAEYAESVPAGGGDHPNRQEKTPWDPMVDYAAMMRATDGIMALWRSRKPTIAKVHGYAIAGGSDIALCCDLLVMADDAKTGWGRTEPVSMGSEPFGRWLGGRSAALQPLRRPRPSLRSATCVSSRQAAARPMDTGSVRPSMPTRVWGCPTTAMWTYRLGPMRAKQLAFTGDLIDGTTAAAWDLATMAVPASELDAATTKLAKRIAGVPRAQLTMHKTVSKQVMLAMGLAQSQAMANVFDGITRHDPSGVWFRRQAQAEGFHSAVEWRDSGRPIPEGDEARALIAELDRKLAARR